MYSYKINNKNLKFLDNKSYRILNRISKYIKEKYNGTFDEFLEPIKSYMSLVISKTGKQVTSVNSDAFLKYLKDIGIRRST